jgi:hypothetical protein
MGFNLENYETVEDRLIRFWTDHPNGRISTSIHHYDDNKVVFRAEVYFDAADDTPKATGYAEEVRGASPVNKTSHVENAETSAIGRALANCKYAPRGARPSREEMAKVQRSAPAHAPVVHEEKKATVTLDEALATATEKLGARPATNASVRPRTISQIIAACQIKRLPKQEALEMASDIAGKPITDFKQLDNPQAEELLAIISGMAA